MFTPGLYDPNTALMLWRVHESDLLKQAETARTLSAARAYNTLRRDGVLVRIDDLLVTAGTRLREKSGARPRAAVGPAG